jgi:Protein of unknown function DUF2620
MQELTELVRVAVIGIGRDEVLGILGNAPGVEPIPTSDIDAASMLQRGEVSHIIGVCESGGGAALAIPIAIVGVDKCTNLSKLGKPASRDELPALLGRGFRVFGVARDHVGQLVPAIAEAVTGRPTAPTAVG